MVNFPNSLDTWTDVTDDVDTVDDAHMNNAHNSLIAIENILNLMDVSLSAWKVEKDYIFGFEVSQTSVTECVLTSGTVAIAGKLIFKGSTTTLDITSDLRSGESEEANQYYNIYAYIVGTTLTFKFSAIDPNPDYNHPNETGWRAITGIPNVGGDFLDIEQHRGFITYPSNLIFNAAPSGSLQEIDLSNLIPKFSDMMMVSCVVVAPVANGGFVSIAVTNNLNTIQFQVKNDELTNGKSITATGHIHMVTQSCWLIGHSASWCATYLIGVYLHRRRS